ncbi:MAG TPA: hypothetical protein VFQ35_14580, partial [Polyangiaceae bacterium]|nr:hypothetical protein [Polyangiaceae bacterium]
MFRAAPFAFWAPTAAWVAGCGEAKGNATASSTGGTAAAGGSSASGGSGFTSLGGGGSSAGGATQTAGANNGLNGGTSAANGGSVSTSGGVATSSGGTSTANGGSAASPGGGYAATGNGGSSASTGGVAASNGGTSQGTALGGANVGGTATGGEQSRGGANTGGFGGGLSPVGCPPNASFCANFETVALPTGAIYKSTGASTNWLDDFEIDHIVSAIGRGCLKVKPTTEAQSGSAYQMLAAPSGGSVFWARFHIRADQVLGQDAHNVFVAASAGDGPNDAALVELAEDCGLALKGRDNVLRPDGSSQN